MPPVLVSPTLDASMLDAAQGAYGELVEGETLLPPPGEPILAYQMRRMHRMPALTPEEAARVGTGQAISVDDQVELRDLIGWLPAGSEDPLIQVHWTLRSLTVKLPMRRMPQGVKLALLPWTGAGATAAVALPPDGASPALDLKATATLDETAGWLLVEVLFGPPDGSDRPLAMRVMDALKGPGVTVRCSLTHQWMKNRVLKDEPSGPISGRILDLSHLKMERLKHVNPALLALLAKATDTPEAPPKEEPVEQPVMDVLPVRMDRMHLLRHLPSRETLVPRKPIVRFPVEVAPVEVVEVHPPTGPAVTDADEDLVETRVVTASFVLARPATRADVYLDLEGHDRWKLTTVDVGGRPVPTWFRAAAEKLGEFFVLPTEFRLGFVPTTNLPAVRPHLLARPGAEGTTEYRVQVTLAAVPWIDPAVRDALRAQLMTERRLPFASLQLPRGIEASLTAMTAGEVGATDVGAGVPVQCERGFVMTLDVPAERYDLLSAVLASSLGVQGQVHVGDGGGEAQVPVTLSLAAVAARPLVVLLRSFGPEVGRQLVIRNPGPHTVRVARGRAWYVLDGASGIYDAAVVGVRELDEGFELPPGGELAASVPAPEHGSAWTLRVELGEPTLVGVDVNEWVTRVNRQEGEVTPHELRVQVLGLDAPEVVAAGVVGMRLTLTRPDGTSAGEVLVAATAPEWAVSVPRSLTDYAAGKAGLAGLVLEARAVYAEADRGLAQRVVLSDADGLVLVRVPGVEATDARYEVSEQAGRDVKAVVTVDRATLPLVLEGLAARGSGWTLRVAPPVVEPIDVPEDPVVTDPPPREPVTVEPAGRLEVDVVPTTLAFDPEGLTLVLVRLSSTDAATGRTHSGTLQFGLALGNTTSIQRWTVPFTDPSTARYGYTATFVTRAGNTTVTVTDLADPVLLLVAPAAPAPTPAPPSP